MQSRGELRSDPSLLGSEAFSDESELVLPYTEAALACALLRTSVALTAAFSGAHFPRGDPRSTVPRGFLLCRLHPHFPGGSSHGTGRRIPNTAVNPQVVLAGSREEGFGHALRPDTTVLVGTSEERLAGRLVSHGHKVVLLHIEQGRTSR
jgi:hypothetical protein